MKNLTKKDGKTKTQKVDKPIKRLSKEELLDKMYYYLDYQTEIAERKKVQYAEYELNPSNDKNGNPIKNPYLSEFNNQVDAITRTSAAIIRIDNSDLTDEANAQEENHKKHKELVD